MKRSRDLASWNLSDDEGRERLSLPVGPLYARTGSARIRCNEIVWRRLSNEAVRRDPSILPYVFEPKGFALLQEFLQLADTSDEDLCKFAQKYGPLRGLRPMGGEREALADWRYWITQAKAILTMANKLQDQMPTSKDEWAVLGVEFQKHGGKPPQELKRSMEQFSLASHLNAFLRHWRVTPFVTWEGASEGASEIRLNFGGGSLISAIGAQLLSAVCRNDRFVPCSACGCLYTPSRKPRGGENHYCYDCGKKAAKRIAQRKYSARLKSRRRGTRK